MHLVFDSKDFAKKDLVRLEVSIRFTPLSLVGRIEYRLAQPMRCS